MQDKICHSSAFRRKRLRLTGFDYSQNGAYYITICTANQRSLLGFIENGKVLLSQTGLLVESHWNKIAAYSGSIVLDECIIMPDHLHGIILVSGYVDPEGSDDHNHSCLSISQIIQRFKSLSTLAYVRTMKKLHPGIQIGKLWQRGFYDRIIRNEHELAQKREYIATNPLRTTIDQ